MPSLAVAVLWSLAYTRWLWQEETVPWDAKNQFYAFFRFLAKSLHDGTSPFWNPYHYGGHPSIADPQSLIFSPLFVLWAYLDPMPSMRAFDLVVYAHLLIGGLGMAAYGWRRGWHVSASVLAAVVFMFGGAAAGRLNHTGIITSYGWFPLAMLALDVALERRSKALGVVFAGLASCIALGRNQVALLLCFVLVTLAVRHVSSADRPWTYLRQRWAVLGVMIVAGGLILTVPILLTLQFATLSNRPSLDLAVALEASLHPSSLMSMAVPNVFGSLNMMDLGYWGPQASVTPEVSATDDSFNYAFFGIVPIGLLLGLGAGHGLMFRRGTRTWTAILLAALAFSLGRYTPLYPFVFEHVPGFTYFRRPIDGLFVVGIALAVLSGSLLSTYVHHGRPPAKGWAIAAIALVCTALTANVLGIAAITDHLRATSAEIASALPLAALVAGGLWWRQGAHGREWTASALAVVAIGQLIAFNTACRLNGEPVGVYRSLEAPAQDEQAALDVLKRDIARRHLDGARPRVEIIGLGGAWQNLAMVHGLEATNGYNPLRIGLYDRLVMPGESPAFTANRTFTRTFSGYDCPIARALGLEYLVVDRPLHQIEQLSRPGRMDVLLAGPRIWIYRFNAALPRVKFHTHVEVADADALTGAGQLRHPPDGEHALLDDETPPSRLLWQAAVAVHTGEARLASWRPGRIEIDVSAPSAGVLVVHDTYYPGWVATIDGEPASILRADTLFRGVEVPAGRHRVVMHFAPLTPSNLLDAVRGLVHGRQPEATRMPSTTPATAVMSAR